MRKFILMILIAAILATPVSAMDFTAPIIPENAEEFMPEDTETFSEGLWYVIKTAISKLQPSFAEAAGACLSIFAIILLVSILQSGTDKVNTVIRVASTLAISLLLIQPTNMLITLGTQTVVQLCDYGKLLLPVLTAALAAQGGVTSSGALYTGTAIFIAVLTTIISSIIVPMIYIFLCLCIACSMIDQSLLKKLRDFVKWAMTWCLKTLLYVFTGYLSITRVISGTVDASTMKATKLAISGVVPVVGGLISDASETILISAGLMKSAAGTYGLLAAIAMWIGPFIKIGSQYLLLKGTAAVCGVIGNKENTSLISDFSGIMGMLLAMTGTACLLLLVSTVCFMKGVS